MFVIFRGLYWDKAIVIARSVVVVPTFTSLSVRNASILDESTIREAHLTSSYFLKNVISKLSYKIQDSSVPGNIGNQKLTASMSNFPNQLWRRKRRYQSIFSYMSYRSSVIRHFQKVDSWSLFSNTDLHPSPFDVYQRIGAGFSGFGGCPSGFHGFIKNMGLFPHLNGLIMNRSSLAFYGTKGREGYKYTTHSNDNQIIGRQVCRSNQMTEITFRIGGGLICLFWGCFLIYRANGIYRNRREYIYNAFGLIFLGAGTCAFLLPPYYQCESQNQERKRSRQPTIPFCCFPSFHGGWPTLSRFFLLMNAYNWMIPLQYVNAE